jgi:hypothetical protein
VFRVNTLLKYGELCTSVHLLAEENKSFRTLPMQKWEYFSGSPQKSLRVTLQEESELQNFSGFFPHAPSNLKVHYCVHKSPPMDSIQNQMKPIIIFSPYFFQDSFNISHLLPGRPTGSFLPVSSLKLSYISHLYAFYTPKKSDPH